MQRFMVVYLTRINIGNEFLDGGEHIVYCFWQKTASLYGKMRQKKAKKLLEHVKSTYDDIADEFDQTRQHAGAEFASFVRYLKQGTSIADVGCGNGRLILWLQNVTKDWPKPPYHYLGIDNSEKLLQKAKENFPHENFIHGDQLNLPIKENSIDIIFSIRAFHHIPSRKLRLEALAEMQRVLKNNGILIITVWNLWQKKYWKELFRAILRSLYTLGAYAPNDTFISWNKKAKRYYHAFLPMELNNLITNAGFEIEELASNKHGKNHDIVIAAKKVPPYED